MIFMKSENVMVWRKNAREEPTAKFQSASAPETQAAAVATKAMSFISEFTKRRRTLEYSKEMRELDGHRRGTVDHSDDLRRVLISFRHGLCPPELHDSPSADARSPTSIRRYRFATGGIHAVVADYMSENQYEVQPFRAWCVERNDSQPQVAEEA